MPPPSYYWPPEFFSCLPCLARPVRLALRYSPQVMRSSVSAHFSCRSPLLRLVCMPDSAGPPLRLSPPRASCSRLLLSSPSPASSREQSSAVRQAHGLEGYSPDFSASGARSCSSSPPSLSVSQS